MNPPQRFVVPGPHSRFFWSSGVDGRLRVMGCASCGRLHHPPGPVCPYCHSRAVEPAVVSGQGTLATFTINHQPFMPGFEPPYAFGFVELDEDPTIRIATNIVDCPFDRLQIGMRLQVSFEPSGEYFVPLFHPIDDQAGEP